jgi:hypothetical protein
MLRLLILPLLLLLAACVRDYGVDADAEMEPPICALEAIRTKWDLWRQGATCLRGANIWQKVVEPSDGANLGSDVVGPEYDQDSLDALAAMGANYINVSFPGLVSETPPYAVQPKLVAYLDALFERVRRANLFAVLSFRTGPGRNEATFGGPGAHGALNTVWESAAAQAAWAAMWAYTADRYKGTAVLVGYDLMVEPNANDVLLGIQDPKVFHAKYKGTLYDWNQLASRITSSIRGEDALTPLLVGGMDWSSVRWIGEIEPTGDARTVYAIHQYEPFVYTHQRGSLYRTYPGDFDPDKMGRVLVNRDWLADFFQPMADFQSKERAPLAVNEFGVMRWEPGAERFFADSTELFESFGMNHAVWLWETPSPIDWDEFNIRRGPEPSQHIDVPDSLLIGAIRRSWAKNAVRPADVAGRW